MKKIFKEPELESDINTDFILNAEPELKQETI